MSIHVQQSEEAKEALASQRKTSTALSALISVAAICALAGILALITYFIPQPEVETIISYAPPPQEVETVTENKLVKQTRQNPDPPAAASAVANVITSTASAAINIPDTDIPTNVESNSFGSANDFGDSFGFSGTGASFFGANASGERIAFVIDFSQSMEGERDKLMRKELTYTLDLMKGGGTQISLMFFAGPYWTAGDDLNLSKNKRGHKTVNVVKHSNGKTSKWKSSTPSKQEIEDNGKAFEPTWVSTDSSSINKLIKHVKSTPLALGTQWEPVLMEALTLNPLPDTIIFMTDGATGDSTKVAKKIGDLAAAKGVTINAIALLEPKAKAGMKILAEKTGGTAISVIKGGKATQDLITNEITER